MSEQTTLDNRNSDSDVSPLFSKRWSPRAYLTDPVPAEAIRTVIDAARWSPSCYNEQPWLFITSSPASHARFLDCLVEANREWAAQAPVLGFILAKKQFALNGNDNIHASFDTGAAWMAMTLQANMLNLYTHGLGGIDYDKVYRDFAIDAEQYQLICGFTLGYRNPEVSEDITARKDIQDIWQVR